LKKIRDSATKSAVVKAQGTDKMRPVMLDQEKALSEGRIETDSYENPDFSDGCFGGASREDRPDRRPAECISQFRTWRCTAFL
jgi:hypothetical protein